MFYILNQICNDYMIAQIIDIGKRVVNIIRMVSPILLILGLSINFFKGTINPNDKNIMKKVGTSIASTIIIFFLPLVINTIMEMISTYGGVGLKENGNVTVYNMTACWNSGKSYTATAKYQSSNSTNKTISKESENGNNNSNNNSNSSRNNRSSSNNNNNNSRNSNNSNNNSNNSNASNNNNNSNNNSNNSNVSNNNNSNNNSNNSNTKNNNRNTTYNKIVLIGDSRFYGQSSYNFENSKTTYIAKSGEGLNFLKNSNSKIKSLDSSSTAFVINLGVNDLYNINNYISYINSLAISLNGKIYYLSVNPVDEQVEARNGYSVKNSQIDDFNKKIKSGLKNVTYLDSNSYLKRNGFNTVDGVHYTKDTYQKISNFITKNIKN